ncbi:hypothetical protein C8Q74DRAFT_19915 [Fomes fomentarius]|nr:hypothetical protein C8Q74DRAFT_19915 [Fomes fomentarius]
MTSPSTYPERRRTTSTPVLLTHVRCRSTNAAENRQAPAHSLVDLETPRTSPTRTPPLCSISPSLRDISRMSKFGKTHMRSCRGPGMFCSGMGGGLRIDAANQRDGAFAYLLSRMQMQWWACMHTVADRALSDWCFSNNTWIAYGCAHAPRHAVRKLSVVLRVWLGCWCGYLLLRAIRFGATSSLVRRLHCNRANLRFCILRGVNRTCDHTGHEYLRDFGASSAGLLFPMSSRRCRERAGL